MVSRARNGIIKVELLQFMWQTFGHNTVKQLLTKQLERHNFSHAYLFIGPTGIGKKMLASEMAEKILNTQRLDTHPDFLYYDCATDFGMENLRTFLSSLGHKPFIGQHKVAVIDNIDQANVQMNNALLKTLEEPSPGTILFVIAGQNNLLPTITSRCQTALFAALTPAELKDYAQQNHLTVSDELLVASFGSPARLRSLLNDAEATQQLYAALNQLQTAWQGGTAEKLLAVNTLAEYETATLRNILLTWLYQKRQELTNYPERYRLLSALSEAITNLNGAFNKKMVLQRLLLQSHAA